MSLSSSSSTTLSVSPLQSLSTNSPVSNSYSITSASSITKGMGPSLSFDELTSLFWEIGMATNLGNPFGPGRYWLSEWDPATSAYASTCSAIWDSSYLHFIQTEIVDGHLTWTPGPSTEGCFYEMNDPSTCKTRNYMVYPTHWGGFSYTPTTPCCGTCALTAGDVRVYHWPQATTTPSISELVDSKGFTLTFPSVYVAFQNIYASDLCGTSRIHNTTMGFDMQDLSTATAFYDESGNAINQITSMSWWSFSALNYSNTMNCTEIVTTLWASPGSQSVELSSTYVLVTYWRDVSVSTGWSSYENTTTWPYLPWPMKYNPCNPYLSIPAKILSLDPHWQYCTLFFKAMQDPPTLLDPENGFFPVTITSPGPESPSKTNAAMTAQAVQQTMATKTPAPETQLAPGTKPTPSPPGDPQVVQPKQPAVITICQSTITANSASAFVIGTQTLAPGQQITASGAVLSMAPDRETLFLGGSSVLLGGGGSNAAMATGVDGVGAGERVQSNSASRKREGDYWVVWKIALWFIGVGLFA